MNGSHDSRHGPDGEEDADHREHPAEGRRDDGSGDREEGVGDPEPPTGGRLGNPPDGPLKGPASPAAGPPTDWAEGAGDSPGGGPPDPEVDTGRRAPGLPRIPLPRQAPEDGALPRQTPPGPLPAEPEGPEGPNAPDAPDAPEGPRDPYEPDPAAAYGPAREDRSKPPALPEDAAEPKFEHHVLKSLLGAWALSATAPAETAALETHLADCGPCADEALRLRDAVGLLHPEESLDLDPMLRSRVLAGCLDRRPAQVPIPEWAVPYDTETARLAALLHDMAEAEWRTPVRLRWFAGEKPVTRETTVAGVIEHLLAVDGLLSAPLGLTDPLSAVFSEGPAATPDPPLPVGGPTLRTEALWRARREREVSPQPHLSWREQGRELVRTVSFAGSTAGLQVPYGDFTLPIRDAFLDRAFECWVHAGDIAEAVDYPYDLPAVPHLRLMVDFAARQLPGTLARRRRSGLAAPARLSAADAPGRTLHLEVEGAGGGDWYIPLDSPGARAGPEAAIAHVALDGAEFCQLAAGHVAPGEAAAGQEGDRDAIREVLYATAALSRL